MREYDLGKISVERLSLAGCFCIFNTHCESFPLFAVMLYNGTGEVVESGQPLFDGFLIIVHTSTCLAAFQQTFRHRLIGHLKVEHSIHSCHLVSHRNTKDVDHVTIRLPLALSVVSHDMVFRDRLHCTEMWNLLTGFCGPSRQVVSQGSASQDRFHSSGL